MSNKKTLIAVAVLAVLVLAVPLVNLLSGPPVKLAAGADPASPRAKVADRLSTSCTHCHVAGAPLPFYATLPPARGVVADDVSRGNDAYALVEVFPATPEVAPNEVALAELEHAVASGSMPPTRYLALHWNAGLSEGDRKLVEAFVGEVRQRHYATAGVPEKQARAVLQPLPALPALDPAKVALGEKLYHDTRLSGDDTLSCASCHGLDKGGTDQAPVSTGIRGQKGGINSPTTFNAGMQVRQFWDGRAADLKEQAAGPVANPVEMGATWPQVVEKLGKDKEFVKEFTAAYPAGISQDTVTDAIATFEKTLVTPNSAFDRWVAGDDMAMTEQQKRGHEAFVARGCASCHVGRVVGGQSFEKMGRKADYFALRGSEKTDADAGRYNFTKQEKDRGKFKVPILRNVALTYPYFHDASAKTLDQAVVTMAKVQLGLQLTDNDAQDITAFLASVTGEYKGKRLQ